MQVRHDLINLELDHTEARQRIPIWRRDQADISSGALWWTHDVIWSPWLKTQAGLRLEGYAMRLASDTAANGGATATLRPLPKMSVTVTPSPDLELYGQAGVSYRTNDLRGVFDHVPAYAGADAPAGTSRPVVRSEGAEIGARFHPRPGLTSTLAIWGLRSSSELFFSGDSGAHVDADRPGARYGVEWNTDVKPVRWLSLDVDVAASQAHFTDHLDGVGSRVPEAIGSMVSASATVVDPPGAKRLTASLRLRYVAPRNLTEDGTQKSHASTVLNGRATYRIAPGAILGVEILNLADARYADAEYYDAYRLKGQAANPATSDGSYMGRMIHPGEPREARLSLTLTF